MLRQHRCFQKLFRLSQCIDLTLCVCKNWMYSLEMLNALLPFNGPNHLCIAQPAFVPTLRYCQSAFFPMLKLLNSLEGLRLRHNIAWFVLLWLALPSSSHRKRLKLCSIERGRWFHRNAARISTVHIADMWTNKQNNEFDKLKPIERYFSSYLALLENLEIFYGNLESRISRI